MTTQVLVLLDDAAAGAALLELSSALARALQRELSVVYVENVNALSAAALPFTRVLAHGGLQWVPLQAQDVELAFRAQAARVRELAESVALRDALPWSLRVVRGSLSGALTSLVADFDLTLVAPTQATLTLPLHAASRQPGAGRMRPDAAPGTAPPRRRPRVTALQVGQPTDEANARVLAVATQMAQALGGLLETARVAPTATLAETLAAFDRLARSDVLVLPRVPFDAAVLARLRCPVLWVG